MSEPSTFLSRVYDAKHRFMREHGSEATQLFLGPAESLELREYVKQLQQAGLLIRDPDHDANYKNTLAGMKVIGLASDGMRAGVTAE